jgi:hypothetical protein
MAELLRRHGAALLALAVLAGGLIADRLGWLK